MPTWFRLPSFQSVLSGIFKTFARFPLPLVCAIIFTLMGLAATHNFKPFIDDKDLWIQFQIIFGLGFFLLLSIKVIVERHNWSFPVYLALSGTGTGLISLLVFSDSVEWNQLVFIAIGILSFIFVTPFLNRNNDNNSFWNFNAKLAESAIHAILSLVVLAAGISAAFGGVEYLFDLDIDGKVYSDIWIVSAFLIGPWVFLAGIPQDFDKEESNSFPEKCNFFVTFILVPLVALYVAILYAYIVKILIQWELPKGQVTYLVISYSSLGVLTHLLAFKVLEKGNRGVETFDRYFYPSLFAPLILLIVGITERVSAYGITENRYAVILLTLWLTLTTLYFIFGKEKWFKIIPLQLSLLFLLSSFGPWGVEAISQKSQLTRLEKLLTKNEILVNGEIVKAISPIPHEDSKNISSIVGYLVNNHNEKNLPSWLNSSTQAYSSKSKFESAMQALGVTSQDSCEDNDWFHLESKPGYGWKVTGFDFISKGFQINRSLSSNLAKGIWKRPLNVEKEKYELTFDNISGILTVSGSGKDEVKFDINPLAKKLLSLCKKSYPQKEMILDSGSIQTRVRLVFENIQGKVVKDTIEFSYLSFSVLLGKAKGQPPAAN